MATNKCAACNVLNGAECGEGCIFAPYFPSTNPQKFENVNRVFGAVNVHNFLTNTDETQRDKVVMALCYEAEARKNDPVHGFVGTILDKERHLRSLKDDIVSAQKELADIVGPDNVPPFVDLPMPDDFLNAQPSSNQNMIDVPGCSSAASTSNQNQP